MLTRQVVAALFVVGIGYLATPTEAHADFIVRVDNLSTPAGQTVWGSPDHTIIVHIKWTDNTASEYDVPDAHVLDTYHDIYVSGRNYSQVQFIDIYNSTDDMFGLDRVHALTTDYYYLHSWGAENSAAWCISTDHSDGSTPGCNPAGVACTGWDFYPNDTVTGRTCN